VSGSVVDLSQLIDERVADVIRDTFPPGVINQAAMASVKRQLALFWLGFTDESSLCFESLQMVSIAPSPSNDASKRYSYTGVQEWDFNLVSRLADRRALSLHVAVDERGTLGQRTKEMVENVTENRRYSVIFAQESIW